MFVGDIPVFCDICIHSQSLHIIHISYIDISCFFIHYPCEATDTYESFLSAAVFVELPAAIAATPMPYLVGNDALG